MRHQEKVIGSLTKASRLGECPTFDINALIMLKMVSRSPAMAAPRLPVCLKQININVIRERESHTQFHVLHDIRYPIIVPFSKREKMEAQTTAIKEKENHSSCGRKEAHE